MIVTCPNCDTKFAVPDDAYIPGRRARCSSCSNIFSLQDIAAPMPVVTPDDILPPQQDPASFPAQQIAGTKDSYTLQLSATSKKFFAILLCFLVLSAVAIGGGYYLGKHFAWPSPVAWVQQKFFSQVETDSVKYANELLRKNQENEKVKGLRVRVSSQYNFTENKDVGRFVVVEGRVLNTSEKAKDLILVEVLLLDKKGKVLAGRQQYCGIALSEFQLKYLGKAKLEEALMNKLEIYANNAGIMPGADISFTTLFFYPPPKDDIYEIMAYVVDANDTETK